tara:strand:- start:179 stop:529 length:351 start_codon:yes stop_codon:yes gene_type:complete
MKDYKPFSQDCDYDIRALRRETIEQLRNDEAIEKARHEYALKRSLYGDYDYPNTWDDEPTEWSAEEAEMHRLQEIADFISSPERPVLRDFGGNRAGCPFIENEFIRKRDERTRPNF